MALRELWEQGKRRTRRVAFVRFRLRASPMDASLAMQREAFDALGNKEGAFVDTVPLP